MNFLEIFGTVVLGNFVFYMGVRTYYRVVQTLQQSAMQRLIKSGQVKIVSMDQLQGMVEKDEKKSWN